MSFTFSDTSKDENIKVAVSTISGDKLTEKNIDIRLSDPEVILYEESPSEGTYYQKALNPNEKLALPQRQIALKAEPYYFLKPDVDSISYGWAVNNSPVKSLSAPNTVGLTVPGDAGSGTATLNLEVKNAKRFFQNFTKDIQLTF